MRKGNEKKKGGKEGRREAKKGRVRERERETEGKGEEERGREQAPRRSGHT